MAADWDYLGVDGKEIEEKLKREEIIKGVIE